MSKVPSRTTTTRGASATRVSKDTAKNSSKRRSRHRASIDGGSFFTRYEFGGLTGLIGFWLRRAHVEVIRSFGLHLGELNLRPIEVATLFLVSSNRGITQTALAEALGTDQSTVVSLLLRLEARKLIARERLAADRRFQVVRLTSQGQRTLAVVEHRLEQHNELVTKRFTSSERASLITLLKKMVGE